MLDEGGVAGARSSRQRLSSPLLVQSNPVVLATGDLKHPLYSHGMRPYDYDLFFKVKEAQQGIRYNTGYIILVIRRSIQDINWNGRTNDVRRLSNIRQNNGGDYVEVHITGTDEFKGVYMQARRENGEPVGEFLLPNGETSEINVSDCPPGHKNAYSYISSAKPLKTLDVDWKAPNIDEKIVFRATFVKSFSVFWVGVESERITVKTSKSATKRVNAAAA